MQFLIRSVLEYVKYHDFCNLDVYASTCNIEIFPLYSLRKSRSLSAATWSMPNVLWIQALHLPSPFSMTRGTQRVLACSIDR